VSVPVGRVFGLFNEQQRIYREWGTDAQRWHTVDYVCSGAFHLYILEL
jgi:hypothetical protein